MRPPVEEGVSANKLWHGRESAAAQAQHILKRIEVVEGAIDQRFVEKRPEPLGRLQLRRIGRQLHEVQAIWKGEFGLGVITGAIE